MRISLFILCFFLCGNAVSQSVVSAQQNNVLMRGIPNELSIGLKGVAADSVSLRAEKCSFEKLSMWYWRVTPDTSLTSVSIIVEAWAQNKPVVIDTMYFRLKWLPDPHVYAGNSTGQNDSATRSELQSVVGISARGHNVDQDAWYRVQSYRMTLSDDTSKHYVSGTPYMQPEMRVAIKNAKQGTVVTFDEVMVLYPDKRVRKVEGVRVKMR